MDISAEIIFYILVAILIHLAIYKYVSKTKRKNISSKHIVITGGSSGIGFSIAIICTRKGANVTILARNSQKLENALSILDKNKINPQQKLMHKSVDLASDYDCVSKAFVEIEEKNGPIYMLVNCAGMAICGVFEEISIKDAKLLMDVNYYATYYCTRYVLPKMKLAKDGIIVITASQAALMGIYGYGSYAATKFALRGMAETIAMECKHKGVSITLALPCDTDTPGFETEEKSKPLETKIISSSGGLAKPEDVAKRIVDDALAGNFFSILGFESWLITLLCCGMAPWGDILLYILQACLMGPLRLISVLFQWHFQNIIKKCEKQKTSENLLTTN